MRFGLPPIVEMESSPNRGGVERSTVKMFLHYNALNVKLDAEAQHGCASDCRFDGFLWDGGDSRKALFGHRSEQGDLLQHAAQDLRFAVEAAVHLHQGGGAGPTRGHRQRLRIREGPVWPLH